MLRVMAGLALVAALAGCQRESEKAKSAYEMMERTGASEAELCKQADVVTEAYLREQDQKNYEFWRLSRDGTCQRVKLCAQIGGCG